VDATGNIRAITNGVSVVTAISGSDTGVVAVHVAQRPVRVLLPSDTARFVALGETQVVQGIAVDSLGNTVTSIVQGLRLTDYGRNRTKEAGIRAPNSGVWSTGEGMDAVQLPTGEWQLIVGGSSGSPRPQATRGRSLNGVRSTG
jgi:hypothetical protein